MMPGWHADPAPPEAAAVVGCGPVARRLLQLAAARLASSGADWQVTAHDNLLFLRGAGPSLPWCDGVLYAAPRAEAPSLWLHTAQRPGAALDLLQQAIQQRHGRRAYLLLREPAQLVALDRLQPASAELLAAIGRRWG